MIAFLLCSLLPLLESLSSIASFIPSLLLSKSTVELASLLFINQSDSSSHSLLSIDLLPLWSLHDWEYLIELTICLRLSSLKV